MKIRKIQIRNLGVHQETVMEINNPVTMILGHQESGKSMIAEALSIAMTGRALRVQKAKDLGHLIGPGGKNFNVRVDVDGVPCGGKVTKSDRTLKPYADADPEVVHALLESRRLAQMSEEDRRDLFLRFLGLQNVDAQLQIIYTNATDDVPTIVSGALPNIEMATKCAVEERRRRKRNLSALDNTTLVEAPTAPEPIQNIVQVGNREHDLSLLNGDKVRGQVSDVKNDLEQARAHVIEQPEEVVAIKKEQDDVKVEMAVLEAKIQGNEGMEGFGICPILDKTCTRITQDKILGVTEGLQKKLFAARRKADRLQKKIDSRMKATTKLRAEHDEKIEELRSRLSTGGTLLSHVENYTRAKIAEEKKKGAIRRAKENDISEDRDRLEASVARADLLVKYLEDGLRRDMLHAPIYKIRSRVEKTSKILPGHDVKVNDDLTITVDGRPVDVCSESEQFRVWFIVQEALSYVSGLKMLLVDRLELMKGPFQKIFMATCAQLAKDYDTIILIATADEKPKKCPKNFSIFWVDKGDVRHLG